jgi:hypothetical protein
VFLQITRTTPLRRTILQFSQILLTLARTFIVSSLSEKISGLATVESEILAQRRISLKWRSIGRLGWQPEF